MVSDYILSVDIEYRNVLPLRPLNADPDLGHPGAPDTAVGGPHHFDRDPTPDIHKFTGVGLTPLGGEASG